MPLHETVLPSQHWTSSDRTDQLEDKAANHDAQFAATGRIDWEAAKGPQEAQVSQGWQKVTCQDRQYLVSSLFLTVWKAEDTGRTLSSKTIIIL